MYQKNTETNKIEFSHNPFSMPQGGLDALEKKDLLDIKAYQYDIVCNGVELSSGAIRNHKPEIMIKAFEIAGYSKKDLEKQFSGLLEAFNYGAPPHGGCAPGIDRIVMLIAGEPNIREIIPFPFNQKAEDLMINAPAEITEERLKELSLKILDLNINSDSLTKPDLIFLDINMPQMDGFQFFNELRKFDLKDPKPIHIYMLSSSLSLEDINKAKSESLCSGYITKPLTVEKLKTILETVSIEDKNYNYKKPI